MNTSEDYYEILGVKETATAAEIKAQYRFLSQAFHPDKFPSEYHKQAAEEKFKTINEAYQVLSDASERAYYDASRRRKTASPPRSEQGRTEPPPSRPSSASARSRPAQAPPYSRPEEQSSKEMEEEETGGGGFSWKVMIGGALILGLVSLLVLNAHNKDSTPDKVKELAERLREKWVISECGDSYYVGLGGDSGSLMELKEMPKVISAGQEASEFDKTNNKEQWSGAIEVNVKGMYRCIYFDLKKQTANISDWNPEPVVHIKAGLVVGSAFLCLPRRVNVRMRDDKLIFDESTLNVQSISCQEIQRIKKLLAKQ